MRGVAGARITPPAPGVPVEEAPAVQGAAADATAVAAAGFARAGRSGRGNARELIIVEGALDQAPALLAARVQAAALALA